MGTLVLRNQLYYRAKPLIPRFIRLQVRRLFASRKRDRIGEIWPILPGSEHPPIGWQGWPQGKKFALVLTHDVEGQQGLDRCVPLMDIESNLGFKSSFNFIPESDYAVSSELRERLVRNGFEVGVHDLKHDGKLYFSRETFKSNARKINEYLKDWNAVGFRSGFMHHNLEWLGDLDALYDASTFDTDPLEPQPDGAGTIFPFWMEGKNGRPGYVELPYTLPQDFTTFVVLKEKTIGIWKKKLDWVASHGGMALLNVHPDYIRFNKSQSASLTFPVERYVEFLEYARTRYGDAYWNPLPKELAQYVAPMKLKPAGRKPRRVCMITHSYYEMDIRVTRYAEALAQRGDEVDIVSLRRDENIPVEEKVAGVNVHRLQTRIGKKEKSKFDYLWPLLRFLFVSSYWLTRRHRRNPYDVVHVHNIPDFMVFAAWYPKITGAEVVLDIHDIVPEFFASKFGVKNSSLMVNALKKIEWASAKFADHVILANHLWLEKYTARSAAHDKCSVFINNVDSTIFKRLRRTRNDDKLIILFPGGLQWHQGVDIAIRAFKKVVERIPNAQFHIYGDGNMKPELKGLVHELGLTDSVLFFDPLRIRQVAEVMANADLGVVPKRANSFGNEAYSTKIMEFMSIGVPVVVSSTKIDRFYFDDSVVRFFESGNIDALAEAMVETLCNTELRKQMVDRASNYAASHSWDARKSDYFALVDSLCSRSRRCKEN